MAKIILPYKVKNRLAELIEQKAISGKRITDIEIELAEYCGLTIQKTPKGYYIADAIKKYKYGKVDPSLPIALKIAEFFEVSVEDIWGLKEE